MVKTYLITGGAGFIGSHLIEYLLKEGNKIINIDNFNNYYDINIKIRNVLESTNKYDKKVEKLEELKSVVDSENYKLEIIDIINKEELNRVFKENKIDIVINLAAMAGVRPSLENPQLYEEVNIKGFMNILEMCKKYNIKKVIQASSSSVYGNNKRVPFKEIDIVDFAISPYAATKKACEVMGHVYYHLYNIDMIQLRFFTVYGPRQRPDLAIHKFTRLITEGKEVPFYGDGTTERDYTYIEDIIDGITKAIKYIEKKEKVYEIINLGESQTISLKEMLETLEEELGKKAKLKKLPMQLGDVKRTNADISKAKELLGYNPKTNFKEGIQKFVQWYKKS
ncbi:UDP-glucuronate 4-epimerase [Hypnocyclicus thermotrophus]|uniref:UDP-glucuronate 4-epimerase n=1 Tax=Hypnocyclicus thermotrophus TaxID=1627895 RepID=A0AA46DX71_9FUSO|nr:GDP-mannose 4,6-dehydratase [Hypnocyclicus thermotrophus]TDT67889.1 UDP-glucuronate 4-epimerase [Hypnocyclicus thermotrophus]